MNKKLKARIAKQSRKELAAAAGMSYTYLSNIINEFYPLTGKALEKLEAGLTTLEQRSTIEAVRTFRPVQ